MNSALIFSLIKTIAGGAAIGVGLAFLIWYLYRSLYVGLVLILLLFLTEAAAVGLPYFSVGLSAYPSDIVFLLIGVAAMFRAASIPHYSKSMKIWFFIGAVLLASFAMGVLKFGTGAGVEFRQDYYFWIGVLYFATFTLSERQLTHIVHVWSAAAALVVAVVVYRWLVLFAGGDTSAWDGIAGSTTLRVVNAGQTLFISQALIMAIYLRMRSATTTFSAALLPVFAIAVLVLQHRTVWAVTLASLLAIFYLERKARGRLAGNLATMIIVAVAILIPVLVASNHLNAVTDSLQASVAEAQGKQSTLVWRVEGWQELLKTWAASGPWHYLFGSPYGSGAARFIPGVAQEITVSAHSHYVTMLLRIGLAGIVAFLAIYVRALRVLFNSEDRANEFPRRGLLVLLLGQLVFFIAYSPDYSQGVLLGTVLALIAREELEIGRPRRQMSAAHAAI